MDTPIAPTQDMVDFVSRDDAMRHAYLSEWMAQMDQVGWLSQAREDGREEKALETARNLLAMGLTPGQVSKGVELPLETVKKIAYQIKQENGNPWIPNSTNPGYR